MGRRVSIRLGRPPSAPTPSGALYPTISGHPGIFHTSYIAEPRNLFVIDASITVKWFITSETDSQTALKIRNTFSAGMISLIVPDLLFYEVASALRNLHLGASQTSQFLTTLFHINMHTINPSRDQLQRAVARAGHFGISLYDAVYLAIAEEARCPVITSDAKCWKRVNDPSRMLLLSQWNGLY